MALVLNDRVKETTTTTGTGTINLGGAPTGFETFVAGVGDSNTTYYCITAGAEFEVGIGTVTDATPDTLSRTTILSSSNSDSAVDFSAGTKDVFCTLPASKAVFEDASGDIVVDPNSLIILGDDDDALLESKNTSASSASQFKISHNLGSDVIQSQRGDLTLDVAGDIVLDADGGDILLKDGGTLVGTIGGFAGNNVTIKSEVSDGDVIFQGNDGGSGITALTLDMSSAGRATFNENVKLGDNGQLIFGAGDDLSIYHDSNNSYIADNGTGDLILDSNSDIVLDADGGDFTFKDGGTTKFQLQNSSDDVQFVNNTQDKDIKFMGDDGGSTITALTLDMSEAGAATFNGTVTANAGVVVDNITIDGSTITAGAANDFNIDASGDIILDADGADIKFKDAGTQIGQIEMASASFNIRSMVSDADLLFKGNDGGSTIIALTLDMSAAGAATFNSSILIDGIGGITVTGGNNITISGSVADHAGLIMATHAILPAEAGAEASANVIDIGANGNEFKSLYLNTSIICDSDFLIDAGGDIILDADGENIKFKDAGTEVGQIDLGSQNFTFRSQVDDKDIIFRGQDSTSEIVALTLDMSEEGDATFNNNIKFGDNGKALFGAGLDLALYSDGTNGHIESGGNLDLDVTGDIILDANGGDITFKDGGTEFAHISNAGTNLQITSAISDNDVLIVGNDGGSTITALTIDMSEAGAATFNNNVTAFSDERLKDNIETLEDGLTKVEQLRGVTYTRDSRENIGVIAQEVEKILPEIVLTADDEMGTKSVDYSRITAVLIEAVKELSAKVKELESK